VKPNRCRCKRHENYSQDFNQFEAMFVLFMNRMLGRIRFKLGVARFIFVEDRHAFSGFLVEITLDYGDQVVCSCKLCRLCLLVRAEYVESHMAFDQLRHQAIECAAAGSDQLQYFLAFAFSFKRSFNGFHLAFDAPDARKRPRLVSRDV
jgi:hypothetical protein